MNIAFLHTHTYTQIKITLESKANVSYFNSKRWEIKKLSQICTHFRIEGIERQNWPNWILKKKLIIYESIFEIMNRYYWHIVWNILEFFGIIDF